MELAAAEARAALAEAEATLARAKADAVILAVDLPRDAVPVLPRLPELPGSLTGGDRTDLEAARADLEAARAAERLASRFVIFPSIEVGWTRIRDRGEVDEGPMFGLSVELPLFDRAQGDRSRSAARGAVAQARLAVLEGRVTAERSAARAAYTSLRSGVEEVGGVVAAAPATLDAAWASFSAGELGLADLLETVRSVHGSELAELELRELALAAHRELELAVGRPLTTEGGR
jgi:cobalt-zinc-cadmium efflux system outer membrane protein